MKDYKLKITLIGIILFIIINNIIFYPNNILCWDVFGYYLYLPLKFIYHDLGIKHFDTINSILDKYHSTSCFYQGRLTNEGIYVMKYTMGLSIFYAPFFFIGHIWALLSNYPADGFSIPYQYSILAGGVIYSILAIIILAKVLRNFFTERVTIITLLVIVLATNYIVHITLYGQNANSHNYLFFTYSVILWLTIQWHKSHKTKHIILLAIACGLSILSRPSEIVCLLIPLLWGVSSKATLIDKIKLMLQLKKQIIIFAITLTTIGLFQVIYWKIYNGTFYYNGYGGNPGEGFEFLHPYILEVLFSFRKGWLLYTPIMGLAIIGFYFTYKRNVTIFYALFVYFLINLYVVSSWSCWWYAACYSQRALIPSYPIMAICFGYFLTWLSAKKSTFKFAGYTLIALLLLLNIFQTMQYHYGTFEIDRMTKEYYFAVFGKLHSKPSDKKLLLIDRGFGGPEHLANKEDYTYHFLTKIDYENTTKKDATVANSGHYSFKMDSTTTYSPFIECPYKDMTKKDHLWIIVTAYVYPTMDVVKNPFNLTVCFVYNNSNYKYNTFNSDKMNLELNKWNKITFEYLTPEIRTKSDKLRVFFEHKGNETFYIDDVQVDYYEKK